jgi:hypothetical protein
MICFASQLNLKLAAWFLSLKLEWVMILIHFESDIVSVIKVRNRVHQAQDQMQFPVLDKRF